MQCRDWLQKARRDPRLQLLTRSSDRLPRIPEGDIAVAIDAAARAAVTGSRRFEEVDDVLRRWPAAGVSLLAVAIALGAALLR